MKCKKWKGRKRNAQRSKTKSPLPLRLEAIGVWVWSGGGWCSFVWFLEVLLVDFWLVFVFWWLGRAWLGWEDLSLYFGLYGLYFLTFYKPL